MFSYFIVVVVQLLSCVWHLWPHGLQHARLPCPSPTPGACSNSCPLRRWCHPSISSSVAHFSSCPHSFPVSGLFHWVGLLHQVAKVLELQLQHNPSNDQDWFPLGLTGLISLLSKGLSRVFSSTTILKHHFFSAQLSHPYMTTGKIIVLTTCSFVGKAMSLLFHTQSRFVIAFLLRSNYTVQYCCLESPCWIGQNSP